MNDRPAQALSTSTSADNGPDDPAGDAASDAAPNDDSKTDTRTKHPAARTRGHPHRLTPWRIIVGLQQSIGRDHLGSFAAALSYRGLLTLFPLAILVLAATNLFGAPNLVRDAVRDAHIPQEMKSLLLTYVLAQRGATNAFALSAVAALIFAMWGASGIFRSVMEALNVVYQRRERRGIIKRYAASLVLAIVLALLLVSALVLVVAGDNIARAIGNLIGHGGAEFVSVWSIAQWPVLVALVLGAFGAAYRYGPAPPHPDDQRRDAEHDAFATTAPLPPPVPRARWISVGSVVATGGWLGFSALFGLYVSKLGSFDATYGALAGVVVTMLYMYYTAWILLVCAELDRIILEHRALRHQALK